MDLKKTCLLLTSLSAFALPLPAPIMQQLPLKDASILTAATSDFDHNGLKDYVVVLRYKDEEGNFSIEYGKDPKYSTKEILTLLSSYFKEQAKKEESPKIIKDL